MDCLGSTTNRENFFILERELNVRKTFLVKNNELVDWELHIEAAPRSFGDPRVVMHAMRDAVATIRYHTRTRTPNVAQRLTNIVNLIDEQISYGQRVWNSNNHANQVVVLEYWREWIKDFYDVALIGRARDWID